MKRACRTTIMLALLSASVCSAETLDAGPFSVEVSPELTLRYQGETLISGDRCVAFKGLKPDARALVDPAAGEIVQEGNVITTLAAQGRNTLRREVMVTAEAVHITFEMRVFGDNGGTHLEYALTTPGEFLDGVQYEAWTGAPRGPLRTETGAFSTQETEPAEYLVRQARYVVLKRPGAECSLDFNPGGPWVGESNYGHNYSTNPWHDGTDFHFLMLCSGGSNGGIFSGKVIIRTGVVAYESIHSTTDVTYTRGFPASLAINFSRAADPAGVYGAYSGDEACRWQQPDAVRIIERDDGGLLYRDFAAPVEAGAEAVLDLTQHSGHYLLTLNVHDAAEATGPFTVTGPDGPLFEDVTLDRGEYWFGATHLRIRDGRAALRLSGDWKVGALTLQPILYEAEDFVLDRPFWNMSI